ncbi:Pup--protein ligase [Mobilicoccus caccae]|uniref:Pup--protein ligase n=1 Tax=Mobilicoccus caccae TaxID=1859295 RepID=A0ABQ6IS78_9MICO|nr:Pup--protein ligase [Mobilicoccus caccae]GMA39577.1 Pup--protein ligase [Mobilicoccus caccae]
MDRRIYGIETEYGLTCTVDGKRRLSPDEIARYMFRGIVARGRSSNIFLANGSRLYLDVGNHPEYATAECDTLTDLIAQDRAGEQIVQSLADEARARLAEEGIDGAIYLFKNNLDSVGASYGCHENYLVSRATDLDSLTQALLPFFVTRQLVCGAGHLVTAPDGTARYVLSQRADVMWEGASSATTRSRPMINTRDEPHADADLYRRLHVIVGDSNVCETTTLVKVGATDLVLRALEAGATPPDLAVANPSAAIRAAGRDLDGAAPIALDRGGHVLAREIQRAYFEIAAAHLAAEGPARPLDERVLDLWGRALDGLEAADMSGVAGEIDWVIKHRLLMRYAERNGLDLADPRLAQLELNYHDIDDRRSLAARLREKGALARVVDDEQIAQARTTAPTTTRAHLRGSFVREAQRHQRDHTVDWSHLRLNDQAAHTVLCKDPFAAQDPRVDRLLASMAQGGVAGEAPFI